MPLDAETFELLKDSVRRFVRDRLMPAEDHVEEHDEVPADIVADMKELGLFGISIPVGSSRVDLQACKLEYSIVSPK